MNKPALFSFLLSAMLSMPAVCQSLSDNLDFQRIIDEYFPEGLNEDPEAYENIFSIFQQQTDLNNVTREQLQSLLLFSDLQINNFLLYRERFGPLLSVYELQTIEGFTAEEIEKLLLFCTLNENPRANIASAGPAKHQFLLRHARQLQQKEGFKKPDSLDASFSGDPNQYLIRYVFSKSNDMEGGFLLEKDPGEKLEFDLENRKLFFDFSSIHFSLKNKGLLKNLTLGDYRFQAGHGLVYGPLFSFGMGSQAIVNTPGKARLQPSRSSYEFKNFSGIGVTLEKGLFSTTLLYSRVFRDATLYEDPEDRTRYFKAFRTAGMHRNANERASHRNVSETHYGMNSEFNSKNGKINIGISHNRTFLSVPMKKGQKVYEVFDFDGTKNTVHGAYFNLLLTTTRIFSEYAQTQNGKKGLVSGFTHQIDADNIVSVLLRNYQPGFHSFKSNAFAQKSGTTNETGIYIGIKMRPLKHLQLRGYIDNYQTKWMDLKADRPSPGREWLLALEHTQYRFFRISVVIKSISEETNIKSDLTPFYEIGLFSQQKYTASAEIFINDLWKWKTRVQWSNTNELKVRNNGFLISGGLNYEGENFQFRGAFNVFDTEDYENRQYIFLNSLPFAYNYGMFHEKGSNINCTVNFYLLKDLLLSLNFIQTIYDNVTEIGAGVDEISGNRSTKISCQMMLNF